MPYGTNSDLPVGVRGHLPPDAQDIYREAFNRADEKFGDEGRAARYAWGAVKKAFHRGAGGNWVKGPS